VLNAVTERDFLTLGIVAAGCVVGIVIFSRVLSWLLKRYYHVTVAALVGFMVGSLWKIWPWKACVVSDLDRHNEVRCLVEQNLLPDLASGQIVTAIVLALVGFVLVSLLDHIQSGKNPLFSLFWRPARASASPKPSGD
jgi:putative membrane protein